MSESSTNSRETDRTWSLPIDAGPHQAAIRYRPRRPVLLRCVTLILVVVASVYSVIWSLVLGNAIAGGIAAAVAIGGMFVASIYRRTGSFSAATHCFTFLSFVGIVVMVSMTGGYTSPIYTWFVVVPMAAMVLDGPRSGAVWLAVVLVEVSLFGLMDPQPLHAIGRQPPEALRLLTVTGVIGISVSIIYCLHVDFLSLERAHKQLHYQAHHDSLTGLLNRYSLLSLLSETLSQPRRRAKGMAVIMVDIDYFKPVNDRYGHIAGDRALKEIAARICRKVQDSDFVGRFGGEEFVCLLPNCSPTEAFRVAESIRQEVESTPVDIGEARIPITVSLGVSTCPSIVDCDELRVIQRADAALYEAKQNGRNQTRVAFHSQPSLTAV